jgi:phosphatidylserine/phosphatidylglycerophosphate/cardiolipin synthase-like enzyme
MLIDDEWGMIGSCNLHAPSLFGNAEINASFWNPESVRSLRCRLFEEHLEEPTEHLNDVAAHRRFTQVARENRRRWAGGDQSWPGLAFSLDPVTYGR